MTKPRRYKKDPEFLYKNRFNTRLPLRDRRSFKEWANTPKEDGRVPVDDMGAYDIQGYWKDNIKLGINPNDSDDHGPDTYKKPNHPSFSNESKYSSKRWPGGEWQEDGGFRPAKHTKRLYGEYLKNYFQEEGRPEYLIEEVNTNDMKTNKKSKYKEIGGFLFDGINEEDPPVGMPILPISKKAKAIAEDIYNPGSPSTTLAPEINPFINAPRPLKQGERNRRLEKQWERYNKLVREMPRTRRVQEVDPARGKGVGTRFQGGGGIDAKKVDKVKRYWQDAPIDELEGIRNPQRYPDNWLGRKIVDKDLQGKEIPNSGYHIGKVTKRSLPRLLTTSHMRDAFFPQFQSKSGTSDASPEFMQGIDALIGAKNKSKAMSVGPYPDDVSMPKEFGGYAMGLGDNLNVFPSDIIDYYDFGGWLKKNVGNVLKTAAGVGAMFVPGAQGVGASLIGGGISGMATSGQADETAEVYVPPVAKERQAYDIPMEGGGNLKQATQRTDYVGPTHEEGGIQLGDIGVEVEGEESRTGDMIHSDKIKLTKPMFNRYKDMVPLRKSDIGKSVAQILKKTDKKFEKRSGDKWNDEARKATQVPFEQMSDELSQIYAIAKDTVKQMQSGGRIKAEGGLDLEFVKKTKKHGYRLPDGFHLKDKKNFEMVSDFLSNEGAYEGQSPIGQFQDYIDAIKGAKASGDTTVVHNTLKKLQAWDKDWREDPGADKSKYFPAIQKSTGGDLFKDFFSGENLPGNMPIIGSAVGAVTSMLRKPEKVKYEQARHTPIKTVPISTEGGINRIRRTFGNTAERMRRTNPRMYMNTMRSLGAGEAEAIGDYSSGITAQNAATQNQAAMYDGMNRSRVGMFNAELAAKEAEANAANRGAKRSATDMYLNNMFTQFGQKSRDDRQYASQDKYMEMMKEHLKGMRGLYGEGQPGGSLIPFEDENELEPYKLESWMSDINHFKRRD